MSQRESVVATPWRRALTAFVVLSLLCAPVSWVDDGITPSWIVYPILLLLALWRLRSGKGALMVGVVALVFLLVHLPFTWAALSGADTSPSNPDLPTSPVQWLVTLFVVPALTSAVGWITWLKERAASSASA
jgi:hypothetical protein